MKNESLFGRYFEYVHNMKLTVNDLLMFFILLPTIGFFRIVMELIIKIPSEQYITIMILGILGWILFVLILLIAPKIKNNIIIISFFLLFIGALYFDPLIVIGLIFFIISMSMKLLMDYTSLLPTPKKKKVRKGKLKRNTRSKILKNKSRGRKK